MKMATPNPTGTDERKELMRLLRDSVERFTDGLGLGAARTLRGTLPGYDPKVWSILSEQGWLGTLIPEPAGGAGLDLAAMAVVVRGLARVLRPEPLVPVAGVAATILAVSRNDHLARPRLSAVAAGQAMPVLADPGSAPPMRLEPDGEPCLSGRVPHVIAGMAATEYIVVADRAGEMVLLLVPATANGLSRTEEPRPDGTFSATLHFEDVREAEVLASAEAARTAFQQGEVAGALLTSAELLGATEAVFAMTLDYMKTRVQFGRPIGSFQALQHRAVDLFIQKEISVAVLDDALAAAAGHDIGHAVMEAARAKARITHAALLIGREAIKLHGAIAYTDDYDAGLFLRRILSLAPQFGNAAENRTSYGAMLRTRGGSLEEEASIAATVPQEFMAEEKLDIDWNVFPDPVFRAGVRSYFEKNYPRELRHLGRRGSTAEMQPWLDRMAAKGWIAPAWPRAHGGMGLDPIKQVIFIEERERVGIARNPDQGVVMFGPMLMKYGTDEQKARYLPAILSAEHAWCQGYSEPEAGSDLASMRTEAVRDGEDYVINGTKIWTSSAQHATHMFLLARTDKTVKKQAGISFFILDLETPGVTIRPITNIGGHQEFCQVFLDDVRVPATNLVGAENQGWSVAKSLLGFERLNNGSPRRVSGPLKAIDALARARGLYDDPVFVDGYTRIYLDIADLKSAYARFVDIVRAGEMPGPEISQLKIWAGECAQRLSEYLIESAGPAGGVAGKHDLCGSMYDIIAPFYLMFPSQIASGSNDIQRNILAKRVLDLPT